MAISLEQFVGNLAKSGLMTAAEVAAFREALPPDKQPPNAETLARDLVRAGKLTKYQAQCVYQGKIKGLVFDEYIVLDKIGQGGMGQVLKARHRTMERIVALKILPPKSVDSPEAVKRFHREVRAAAKLSHPNIVMAFDAREHQGIHGLVMEYVEGKDLSRLVKERGPLELRQALEYVVQAARGLAYAHAEGIVHRDIKPGNLLLDKRGTVKVLDMGLARIVAGAQADAPGTERLTQTGQAMGTCDYMAPEQAFDTHRADQRSDIYSLGCTLHRLLTGNPPYSRDTLMQILIAHREARIPSLRDARPEVPERVDEVFQKMVAKEPEDRQQSMEEVITDLEACLAYMAQPAAAVLGSEESRAAGSDSLLQNLAFLQEPVPPPLPEQQAVAASPDDTLKRTARDETGTSIATRLKQAMATAGGKPLVFFGVAGGVAALAFVIGLIFTLTSSRSDPQGPPPLPAVSMEGEKAAPAEPTRPDTASSSAPMAVPAKSPTETGERGASSKTPSQPAPKTQAGVPARHPPYPIFGYNLGQNPKTSLEELAAYTNVLVIWMMPSDAELDQIVDAAGKTGLYVVPSLRELERDGPRCIALARRHRDVIPAILCIEPNWQGRGGEVLSTFGRQLKQAAEGVELWASSVDAPASGGKDDPIPEEIDMIVVDLQGCGDPASVQKKTDEILPVWIARAKGRPVVLRWSDLGDVPILAPACKPGTMTACIEAAKKHGLAGLLFLRVGSRTLQGKTLVSIEDNPAMVAEIKTISKAWGVKLGEAAAPAQRQRNPIFGYELGNKPKTALDEVAAYTNTIVVWMRPDSAMNAIFDTARKSGLRVVPRVGDYEKDGARSIVLAKQNRDVVPAVLCSGIYKPGRQATALATFGRQLKQEVAGIELWASVLGTDRAATEDDPIPQEVDLIVVELAGASDPTAVTRRTDELVRAWIAKAKGRPLMLYWDNFADSPGLVPACKPGTMNACMEVAKYHALAGVLFGRLGEVAVLGQNLMGIETNPAMVAEIKSSATAWGAKRSEPTAPASPVAPSTTSGRKEQEDWAKPVPLDRVNSAANDMDPTMSADELILVFMSNRVEGSHLWESRRRSTDEPFGAPVKLGKPVNSSAEDEGPCLFGDGLGLWFNSTRTPGSGGGHDLWFCQRRTLGGPFSEPTNLGPAVNSSFLERGPGLSGDGLTLVFESDRPGGLGKEDLWMATRKYRNRPFGKPVNLGPGVNTAGQERDPALSADGLTLVYASYGGVPGGSGDWDLCMSTRPSASEPFGRPVSLGPMVNSPAADMAPHLSADGTKLLFASNRPGGVGGHDIWMCTRRPLRPKTPQMPP